MDVIRSIEPGLYSVFAQATDAGPAPALPIAARPGLLTAVGMALAAVLALASAPVSAGGLSVSEPDALWPQWQARIAVQTASLLPVSLAGRPAGIATSNILPGNAAPRGLQGGSVLGDYTFARPSFGAFRASGGLLIGTAGTAGAAPVLGAATNTSTSRVDLSVHSLGANAAPAGSETSGTVPYVGLGFTGAAWRSLAISADLGLVAERPSNAGGLGRAIFGNQAMDSALRDMRLSPVLQLGVRYTF